MQIPFRYWFAFLWLCLLTFSVFSCKQNKNPCNLPESVLSDIAKLDSLVNVPELRERDSLWNAGGYKETPVYSARHETYRFIWSGAFGDARVCRIEHDSDSYKVTVKEFTKDGDIAESRYFSISEKSWNNITDSLANLGFWTYIHPQNKKVFDPDSWKLEGYKPIPDACTGKRYHWVSGSSPVDTNLIKMCKLLDRLTVNNIK